MLQGLDLSVGFRKMFKGIHVHKGRFEPLALELCIWKRQMKTNDAF